MEKEHESNSSMNALVWMQQPCWAQISCTTHSGLVQTSVYTETRAHSQWAEMKLCIQVPEPIFTFKFVSKNTCIQISINSSTMQKVSSNPNHRYKPLPKKDPSCFICASLLDVGFITFVSPPSDSALLFSQAVSPGSIWWHCCPGLRWSLHCTQCTPNFTWAPKDLHQLCGVCALTFLLQRSELLTEIFHPFFLFSPYSFYYLFHI